jgi:predicted nuclease of restriction endonuclease-like (RecB) superfamily
MKTISNTAMLTTPEYRQFIEDLKARVTAARISAARAVNRDLILLYWDIGRAIVEKQQTLGWGESVVEMVSADLRQAFPGMSGFSSRNVWYMRRFFEVYGAPDFLQQVAADLRKMPKNLPNWPQPAAEIEGGTKTAEFLLQLVAEIPWGHNLLILNKIIAADGTPAFRGYPSRTPRKEQQVAMRAEIRTRNLAEHTT